MSVKNLFNQYGNDSITKIRARIADSNAGASGASSRSLKQFSTDSEFTLFGAEHFKWMEVGRRAGKTPRNFRDIIIQWMKDKGITPRVNTEQGYRSAAFFIARKIRQQGTFLYRTRSFRDIFSSVINQESVNKLIQEIASDKATTISSDIVKQFK